MKPTSGAAAYSFGETTVDSASLGEQAQGRSFGLTMTLASGEALAEGGVDRRPYAEVAQLVDLYSP